jgi:hypothetical protein
MIIALFVDDMFPVCHSVDLAELKADQEALMNKYRIKDLGDAKLMLGMRVSRNRAARTIHLDQQVYAERLLSDCGMSECKPMSTPAQARHTEVNQEATDDQELPLTYRAVIGSLLYAALSTRPDLAHAVSALAAHVAAPTAEHWQLCRRVLRYLKGTVARGLTYGGLGTDQQLTVYSDSDWAGNRTGDARSTTGWLTMIGGGPVSWTSRKQSTVALSSTEAEYLAMGEAVQELLWMQQLLKEIGFEASVEGGTTLHCDNQSAITISSHEKHHQRTKHINVKYHFIREHISSGQVKVQWVPSEKQLADLFTKPLGPNIFLRLREQIMRNQSMSKEFSPRTTRTKQRGSGDTISTPSTACLSSNQTDDGNRQDAHPESESHKDLTLMSNEFPGDMEGQDSPDH